MYILLGSTGTALAAAGVKYAENLDFAHNLASYIVYRSESSFYAKNGDTGKIDYSGQDAATVIQNAINALNNGGIIFMKAGAYPLTSVLNVKSGVQIIGEGCSTTLSVGRDVYGAIKISDARKAQKTRISNLEINGNKRNQTDTTIQTGLITLDTTKEIEEIYLDRIWFKNAFFCDIVNVGYDHNPKKISITHIRSIDCGDEGSGNAPHSLYLTNLEDSYIADYYVCNSYHTSFDIRTKGKRSVFVDLESYSSQGYGMNLYTEDAICIGCMAINSNGHGIRLSGCTRTVLLGCVAMNNSKNPSAEEDGILITGSSNNNTVIGCVSTDNQPSKTQRYGIYLAGDGNIVIGNQLGGNKTDAIFRSEDTNTILRNNVGYVAEKEGHDNSVSDGGTIMHGLATTPSYVSVTGSVAGEIVSVTDIDATNITVAIKKHDGSVGTLQKVYWKASI